MEAEINVAEQPGVPVGANLIQHLLITLYEKDEDNLLNEKQKLHVKKMYENESHPESRDVYPMELLIRDFEKNYNTNISCTGTFASWVSTPLIGTCPTLCSPHCILFSFPRNTAPHASWKPMTSTTTSMLPGMNRPARGNQGAGHRRGFADLSSLFLQS
ncbi:hypothetical protein U0070_007831 [Myodes glareolus]|uniref:Uncharacterized protein n=1 Tax=Myodes glareolus TaxID=447135 RepID=A0AAW0JIB6_MYOGA